MIITALWFISLSQRLKVPLDELTFFSIKGKLASDLPHITN